VRTACPLRGAHRHPPLRASLLDVTEVSSAEGLSATHLAELDSFSRVRDWIQDLLALELCGPDGGESDLLGFRDHPSATLDLTHAHPSGLAMLLAGRRSRLSDLVREPGALADARRRARAVGATATRLRRLHGVSAGQLAVGMASWGEDPDRRSFAPVLLRAASLRPRGHGEDDFDLDLAPATRLNPVFVEHVRIEYGVPLDAGLIAELAAGPGGFDPLPMLQRLAETCADIPGFEVEPRLVVGVFPEAVPALVAELEATGGAVARHPTIRLLSGPLTDTSPREPLADGQAPIVLDADADQQAVVDAVLAGARIAVRAPAGSGTTQALADAIAGLAASGRRSLLLSAYADELADLRDRLAQLGLADLVLDLGDDPHDGARVAGRLLAIVEAVQATDEASQPSGTDSQAEATARDRANLLSGHVEAMHRRHEPWGVSAYGAQVALAELTAMRPAPRSRVRLNADVLEDLNPHRVAELRGTLREVAALGAFRVPPSADPWYAARITSRLEADLALEHARTLADGQLGQTRKSLDAAFEEVGIPSAATVSDYAAGLRLLEQVRETLEVFRPEAWDTSVAEAVAATASREWRTTHGIKLSTMARRRIQSRTRRLLRPGVPPADLHAALLRLHHQRQAWEEFIGGGARPAVPASYDEIVLTFTRLEARLEWLVPRLVTTPAGADLMNTPLDALQERLAALTERDESLAVRPKVVGLLDALQSAGLTPLLEDLADRTVGPELVGTELDLVWWTSVLGRIGALDPRYSGHDGEALRAVAAEFAAADNLLREGQAARLRTAMAAQVRRAVAAHPDQVAELRAWGGVSSGEHGGALLARPRVAMPVARLLSRCAELVGAIAPCWALSPLLTASVLPPDATFDAVIVAQAQSVDLARTAAGIARGTSLVVVGDPRLGGVDSPGTSLADIALNRLPTLTLHSSYRPVAASLVALADAVAAHLSDESAARAVSWDLRAAVRPADPHAVRLDRLHGSGVQAPGGSAIESTEDEVQHVVRLVLDHAAAHPELSLAVVALNRAHADRIRDAVRLERGVHPRVAEFFDADRAEPFIVVDAGELGSVVRDVVALAVGYGRTPHGRVLHQFGAVGGPGGVELLLAAVTRARDRLVVVASIGVEDLDPPRLKSPGSRALRDLLATAAAGGRPQPMTVPIEVDLDAATDSASASAGDGEDAEPQVEPEPERPRPGLDALLEDFALRLEADGLTVERGVPIGVGSGPDDTLSPSIDIGVSDESSTYRVAVESDGPAYAALPSVRARDRMRAERLSRLGWAHVRVWSIDIFRDPAREVARIRRAVLSAGTGGGAADSAQRRADAADPDGSAEHSLELDAPVTAQGASDTRRTMRELEQDVEPAQTTDDTDVGWGELPPRDDDHDDWLREQRPPHWA
jgi:REase_MTES_1575